MNFETFVIFAILVEGVTTLVTQLYEAEVGKPWWQCVKWKMLLAIVIAVGIGLAANIQLFGTVGIVLSPAWLDPVLSGFLASRGASYVYELVKLIRGARTQITE